MTRATTEASETTAQACLRMAEDRSFSIPPSARAALRLAHDELEALSAPPMGEAVARDAVSQAIENAHNMDEAVANVLALYALAQPGSDGALRDKVAQIIFWHSEAFYSTRDPDCLKAADAICEALASTPAIRGGFGSRPQEAVVPTVRTSP